MSDKKTSLTSGALNNPFFFESHQMLHREAIHKIYEYYIKPIDALKKVDIDSYQLVYILNALTNSYVLRWAEENLESLQNADEEVFSVFMSILKGCK
jgi:hypothetical protein